MPDSPYKILNPNSNSQIHLLFHPKSIAVIGASSTPIKGGYRILENLISNGFKGQIFPINPKGGTAFKLKFYKSLLEVPHLIDIAIIYVPNKIIAKVLKECIEKHVKAVIIQAAGFEEVGEAGLKLRDEILRITDNFKKIRVVGPNCTGLTRIDSDSSGFFSSFIVHHNYRRGNIAIISQSGMINGGYLTHICTNFPFMGFKYIASIGNKMDLAENEFLEFFLEDDDVNVIALYLENFKEPRKLIELCRKAEKMPNKQIILLKGGLTEQGQNATSSHTGALAENTLLAEGLIKQLHVVVSESFYSLFQYARTFSSVFRFQLHKPEQGKVAFITVSGGAGTVSADLSLKNGIVFPEWGEKTYSFLKSLYPAWMPPNKNALVDLWPAIESSTLGNSGIHKIVLEQILQDKDIEAVLMTAFYSETFPFDLQMIVDFQNKYHKPIFCWLFGISENIKDLFNDLGEKGVNCFYNLEEMMKNMKILIR